MGFSAVFICSTAPKKDCTFSYRREQTLSTCWLSNDHKTTHASDNFRGFSIRREEALAGLCVFFLGRSQCQALAIKSLWVDSKSNNWQGLGQVPSGIVSSRFSTVVLLRETFEGLCSHLIDNDSVTSQCHHCSVVEN